MDTKRLFTTILIAGALMLLFNSFFSKPSGPGPAKTAYAIYQDLPTPTPATTGPAVPGGTAPRLIVLGSATDTENKLAVTVNTRTAGIQRVELNIHDYAETVERLKPLTLFDAAGDAALPFSTMGVHIRYKGDNGRVFPELDFRWLTGGERPVPGAFTRPYIPGSNETFESAFPQAPSQGAPVNVEAATAPATGPATTAGAAAGQPMVHKRTVEEWAQSIQQDNSTVLLRTQRVWTVESQTPTKVELSLNFGQGFPVAKIFKTFEIDPKTYEVKVSYRIENLTNAALEVGIDQLGASELPRDDPQTDDRFFHAIGLDSKKAELDPKRFNSTQLEVSKMDTLSPPSTKYIGLMNDFDNSPVLWVASSNRFFVTIERPMPAIPLPPPLPSTVTLKNGVVLPKATHMAQADLDLMRYSTTMSDAQAVVRFTGSMMEVAAQSTLLEPITVYMGPKKRDILDGSIAAAVGSDEWSHSAYSYVSVIQLAQGGCYAFCTFDFLARWILQLLNVLESTVALGNYGVAIMILVIIVRGAMHPLTRASQVNMAKMSNSMKRLKPQLDASKRKYEGDKKKQQEDMMRIYRENKVNPAGGLLGCLPMLVQMPIWAALWSGLRTDIDLRHAGFIPGWINDLSHPDTILPHAIPVIGHPLFTLPLLGDIYGLNLLPLLLTGVFFFQMKVNAASQPPAADEQQAKVQKFSQYMIFIFPLFLYSAPSGLNLYIFASTMGGLIDTWLVRKSLRKQGILPINALALPIHEEKAT